MKINLNPQRIRSIAESVKGELPAFIKKEVGTVKNVAKKGIGWAKSSGALPSIKEGKNKWDFLTGQIKNIPQSPSRMPTKLKLRK